MVRASKVLPVPVLPTMMILDFQSPHHHPRFLQQALIMIVHRYRQETFRIILPDNILIEKILNLYRFRKFFQIQFRSAIAFLASKAS